MFLMGGGIKGGKVYGSMPTLSAGNLDDGDVPITTDYRQALSEIVTKRLLNDKLGTVFPGFTPGDAAGYRLATPSVRTRSQEPSPIRSGPDWGRFLLGPRAGGSRPSQAARAASLRVHPVGDRPG